MSAQAAAPAAELREIHRRYGAARILTGVSLRLQPGEILGLAGPSGTGKSTLLRILAALDQPDSGEVELAGAPAWAGRRRRVPRPGYVQPVFQDPVGALNPRWPLWRTITEPLTAAGRADVPDRARRRDLARAALDGVGLGAIPLTTRPAELSVGQCQRVATLRALSAEPAVVLADEPTSALDTVSAAAVLALLRAAAAGGTAIVLVSHDRRVLNATAHRTLLLDEGRLRKPSRTATARTKLRSCEASDTSIELGAPRSPFVALGERKAGS